MSETDKKFEAVARIVVVSALVGFLGVLHLPSLALELWSLWQPSMELSAAMLLAAAVYGIGVSALFRLGVRQIVSEEESTAPETPFYMKVKTWGLRALPFSTLLLGEAERSVGVVVLVGGYLFGLGIGWAYQLKTLKQMSDSKAEGERND